MPASEKVVTQFIRSVYLPKTRPRDNSAYPFNIPAVQFLTQELTLDPFITFIVGENGSGKSTLIEAIAIASGFNAEGGSRNLQFNTRPSESELSQHIRVVRGPRRPDEGFFLRAESFYNVATAIERIGVGSGYGEEPLHEMSHGEAFWSVATHRFRPNGLYILDEPEAALSPQRQLSMLSLLHRLSTEGSQFVVATHSPILMAYPGALIYQISNSGLSSVSYEDTDHYQVTRDFLNNRERYFRHLFAGS